MRRQQERKDEETTSIQRRKGYFKEKPHIFFKSQPIKGLDRNAIYYYSYAYSWEGTQTFSTAPHSRRYKQYLSIL